MSVGRAGSDLHVARVFGGDKAEFDEMVESAAVVRPLARVRPDAEPADAVGGGVDPAAADVAGRGHASGHGHCNVSAVTGPVARAAAPEGPPSVAGVVVPGRRGRGGSRDVRLRDRRLRHLGDCREHLGFRSPFRRLDSECQ